MHCCKHVRSPAVWVLEIEPGYSGRATIEPSLDPLGPFFKKHVQWARMCEGGGGLKFNQEITI